MYQVEDEDDDDSPMYAQDQIIPSGKPSLTVQTIKSASLDADAHVLLFDTEALIIQLLCDEFGLPYRGQGLTASIRPPRLQAEIELKISGG